MTANLCAHCKRECPYCIGLRRRPANRCASCSRDIPNGRSVCAQCVERGFDPQGLPAEGGPPGLPGVPLRPPASDVEPPA
jgi:hypothetical protein